MRSDMGKIAVDAYRFSDYGEGEKRPVHGPLDELPTRGRMARQRRHPGENLSPLYRWLDKQVGRPWDKVYSEIATTLQGGYANLEHIKSHVLNKVERREIKLVDGWPHAKRYAYRSLRDDGWTALDRDGLYVNAAGILSRPPRKKLTPLERLKAERARRPPIIMLDALTAVAKIHGVWYRADLHKTPVGRVALPDGGGVAWRHIPVTDALAVKLMGVRSYRYQAEPASTSSHGLPYGPKWYAPRIRTMSTKEVAQRIPPQYR